MNVKKYLKKVAYVSTMDICGEETEVYLSNYDDSYMTHVGMEDNVEFLAQREITEQLTHGVGFSPKEGKWYGWSHRAIFGFKIGSTCKKGDCHYRAGNIEDEIEAAILFWSNENHINVKAKVIDDSNIEVTWTYDDTILNETLRGTISGANWHIAKPFGHGEWTAKTMDDAKQMAIDFNEGVS
jgi:hypothetical protein